MDTPQTVTTTRAPAVLKTQNNQTRPSALGMSDPIWGPFIHIFVDEKKN